MIGIKVSGDGILIKALDHSQLDAVAELYNCNCDIRYATGTATPITSLELGQRLDRIEASKNEFKSGIFLTDSKYDSADCHSRLTGVVSGIVYDKILWIKLIAILPQFRHMGIGSRTIELLLQYSKASHGIAEVFLSTIEKNNAGMHFWLSQGFFDIGRFDKLLFEGEPPYVVVIFHRRL